MIGLLRRTANFPTTSRAVSTLRWATIGQIARRSFCSEAGDVEFSLRYLDGEYEGITMLSLNRAKAKNALGKTMLSQMEELPTKALNIISTDNKTRVAILRSTVPRVFCAGADLKERATMTQQQAYAFVSSHSNMAITLFNCPSQRLRKTFSAFDNLPMPTISVIEGAALGGGLELALCTDIRIAADSAKIGLPETGLAIIPGAGGTQRLPRIIGVARAKELIFTARQLTGMEAQDLGVVNYATPDGAAMDKAIKIALEILPRGPVALRCAKEAVSKGAGVDLSTGLAIEEACYAQVIPTKDRLEGLQAFREKRKPVYKGE